MMAFVGAGLMCEDLNISQLIAGYEAAVQVFNAADAAVSVLLARLDGCAFPPKDSALQLSSQICGFSALAIAAEMRRALAGWFSAQSAVELAYQSVPADLRPGLPPPPSDDV
jgi:hypothetical protein